MNGHCDTCDVEKQCGYQYKPCDCRDYMKFKAIPPATPAPQAQPSAAQVPVKFLANGTRFKMSFFQNEDGEGNYTEGTHVTCFDGYEKVLDGRWVALVAAEDGRHLQSTQPAQRELSDRQVHAARLALMKASHSEFEPTFDEMKAALMAFRVLQA